MPRRFGFDGFDPLGDEPLRGLLTPATDDRASFGLLSENPLGPVGFGSSAALAQFMPTPAAQPFARIVGDFDRTRGLQSGLPDRLQRARGQTGTRRRDATLRMEPVPKERGRPLTDCQVIANEIRRWTQKLEDALASVSAADTFLSEDSADLNALERRRDSTGDPATRRSLNAEIMELRQAIETKEKGLGEAQAKAMQAHNILTALLSDREDNKCGSRR